jgi:hypothetical protein
MTAKFISLPSSYFRILLINIAISESVAMIKSTHYSKMTIQGRNVVGLLVYVFMDDEGRQLEDSGAAHAHALRIMGKVRRFVPDAANSTWRSGSHWRADIR